MVNLKFDVYGEEGMRKRRILNGVTDFVLIFSIVLRRFSMFLKRLTYLLTEQLLLSCVSNPCCVIMLTSVNNSHYTVTCGNNTEILI